MNQRVEEILVKQIEKEAYSSQLYLSMASWAEINGYKGVSDWMYEQSDEERMHMLKFVKYVNERGGKSIVSSLDQPPVDFESVREIFEKSLAHEQYITNSINEIVQVAIEEKDYTTHTWIQWFMNEQLEEEASVRNVIDRLRLLGDHNLYMFDRDIMSMRREDNSVADEQK